MFTILCPTFWIDLVHVFYSFSHRGSILGVLVYPGYSFGLSHNFFSSVFIFMVYKIISLHYKNPCLSYCGLSRAFYNFKVLGCFQLWSLILSTIALRCFSIRYLWRVTLIRTVFLFCFVLNSAWTDIFQMSTFQKSMLILVVFPCIPNFSTSFISIDLLSLPLLKPKTNSSFIAQFPKSGSFKKKKIFYF